MKKNGLKNIFLGLLVLWISAMPKPSESAYVFEIEANDDSASAQSLNGHFSNTPNLSIEVNDSWDLAQWHASVLGLSGNSTYDYFSFDVGTGASPLGLSSPIVFDTDFADIAGIDTHLTLFGTDGETVLLTNDDAAFDGPGDFLPETLNSFMTYSFDTAGTYFIRVGEWDESGFGGVLEFPGFYNLHVSSVPIPGSLSLLSLGLATLIGIRRKMKTLR